MDKEIKINIPRVSIVMSAFNRELYIRESIESVLNQTYKDFEFIIIDDCSTDNTANIIQEYADKDSRIRFLRNEKNSGLIYSLNRGLAEAKGEYIARMDDDDISLPERFEKQVKYLDEHSDITVLGTFIEAFGCEGAKSWVNITDSDELEVAINFYNPMCHPSVIIRNSFLQEHKLKYSTTAWHAEEYDLWKEIVLNGGKLANLPEVLLKYRSHKKSITQNSKTGKIQHKTAEKVREELLMRFYTCKKDVNRVRKHIFKYPFEQNNKKKVSNTLEVMKKFPEIVSLSGIEKFEKHFLGQLSDMHIFFASDDKFSQHLCVAMSSILRNALPFEKHNFYILDGGISNKNKKKLEKIKQIKDCKIEYIKIDDSLFECCPITDECQHISKQTYYRYLIPQLKPELEKAFYFDCDIVVQDSLNEFWNTDLGDNYVAAVEELFKGCYKDAERLDVENYFNAGILLINFKKWKEENLTEALFKNTEKLYKNNNIKWQDQDVLNYTFKDNVVWMSSRYNMQCNAFYDGKYDGQNNPDLFYSKCAPIIIHYNSLFKPWNKKSYNQHPLWKKYYSELKYTSFKSKYYSFKAKRLLQQIFSVKNIEAKEGKIYKAITVFGIRLKFRNRQRELINNLNFEFLNYKNNQELVLKKMVEDQDKKFDEVELKIEKKQKSFNNLLIAGLKRAEIPSDISNINKDLFKTKNQNVDIKTALSELGDFYFLPNRGNLGDVLIATAEYQYFDSYDFKYSVYDDENFNSDEEFNLVYGGGGLWTKYYGYQDLLEIFKNPNLKKAVILPSSFFECDDLMEILDERFIVFCREEKSYNYCVLKNSKAKFILVDDMAFGLNINFYKKKDFELSLQKEIPAEEIGDLFETYKKVMVNVDIIKEKMSYKNNIAIGYFLRTDIESNTDWTKYDIKKNVDISQLVGSYCMNKSISKILTKTFLRLIDCADIVVTDRLHVGIGALLLRKKIIFIDNSYGKVSSVYDYSCKNYDNMFICTSDHLEKTIEHVIQNYNNVRVEEIYLADDIIDFAFEYLSEDIDNNEKFMWR